MDNENLKQLAEEVGEYVRDQVSGIEDRLADLATDVTAIPEARDGADGERGEKGDKGDSITGPQGERGEIGPEGPPGPVGPAGESIQGEKGEKGDSVIGPEGPQGPAGKDGESIQGEAGQQGERGEKGDQGATGTGIDVPQWVEGVYREGSEVQHHFGQFFRALSDTAESPDVSLDWERVGSAGFRLTGSYAKDFEYRDGDLFVKDFGLFLHKGGESVCIAGRGPQGQKGKAGSAGRDGKAGADGADGKDGSSIEALELRGANLVAVFKNADGEVKDHAVSLEPFLNTAALVTKEAHTQNSKAMIEEADTYVRKLFAELNNHLDDDSATPINFYRGLWKSDVGYQVGDWIRYGTEGYLCKRACRGVMPKNYPNQQQTAADYWQSVSGLPTHGAGVDGDNSGGGGGIITADQLTREGAQGGTKFSQFASTSGEGITGVGIANGKNVKFALTTDAVSVNPNPFRNAKNGQFIGTPEELAALKNQRDVNEFLYGAISDIEAGDIDLEGYATEDWVNAQLEGPTQDEKVALIEAQIQYRGLMDVDADDKPVWPADQTKDRGGWWAYPSSKFANTWNYDKLEWIFTKGGDVNDVAKATAPKYAVGDVIQMQISDNEAGAGTGWRYVDTSPVFVEYKVEELYYPDRLNGNSNTDFPAYRVSKSAPDHRYAGSLPNVVKGMQGDPDDAWIQWYPTVFAFGTAIPEVADVDLGDIEERLECIEDAFPDAEGVVPVPTGDLVLKITGSRPTGAAGEAGKLLMWKAEAGTGGSPYNEVKFPVADVDAIDTDATDVWFKQGELVQKWSGGGGWFTNTNVLHISATETEGDTLVDGLAVEMYYEDPAACFAELISRQESKDDDRRLQTAITELSLGLETLLTQRTHGQWKYIGFSGDNIPRNAGEFALVSDDLSASENILTLNLTDLNGITVGLGDVDVGDYIEIVDYDEPENYALFTCTKKPEGTGISNVELALKDKGQNFLVGETCEIRFFAVNEENVNLAELDDRYLKLSGGEMATSAQLSVNYLKPVNLKHIQYECDPSATHPEALVNRAMVQAMIEAESGGGRATLPEWRLSRDASDGESWEAGTFAAYKSDGTEAIMLADVRAIIFSAVDANGNRMARNLDGVDWQRGFGGAFTLLVNENQSIFSHTAAIKPATQSDIAYFGGEWDAYMIYWVGTHGNAIMSTVDGLSVGTKYQIHCPEIFF